MVKLKFEHFYDMYYATGTISISQYDSWIRKYGTNNPRMYILNDNWNYTILDAKLVDFSREIRIVSDDEDDSDYENDVKSDCLAIEKAQEIFEAISGNIKTINEKHVNCNGRKICSCGCDNLHDGWSGDYCQPYPSESIMVRGE